MTAIYDYRILHVKNVLQVFGAHKKEIHAATFFVYT